MGQTDDSKNRPSSLSLESQWSVKGGKQGGRCWKKKKRGGGLNEGKILDKRKRGKRRAAAVSLTSARAGCFLVLEMESKTGLFREHGLF